MPDQDEYTADPYETEVAANKMLRKIRNDKAKAEVADIAEKTRAERVTENLPTKSYTGNTRAGGGGSGGDWLLRNEISAKNPVYKKGGAVKSASARADGCCVRGKTKGKMV